ncbi:hypothetical protein DLAC_06583 [Tieghemostelium lacteum]|uniref:Major facilitator superfamily (MFS) profile domain-containing protein n=1 Tax=Tieghemostelium lacteum TaxID=361077 RepID=A0A151ZF47_TIELA|nr:hypothetical protein DLAC_06583 [Tieghemostelium lacteum]|eukprot:KYQ92591.1 hypothetical protein DLAC_06583 [Tieghemostelium lacteum]
MYIGRYNFTLLSHTKIKNQIGLSDSQYGWILTFGYWIYAFVSPFMGSIGDLKGPKNVIIVGVIGSGVINCLLGLLLLPKTTRTSSTALDTPLSTTSSSSSTVITSITINSILNYIPPVVLFSFFNALNFMSQSLATGSMSKVNSGWYRKSEIGVFGGIFSAILSTAFFFTFNIGDLLVQSKSLPWNYIFIIPGLILLVCGISSFFVVKENPKIAGFSHIDLSANSLIDSNQSNNGASDEDESNSKQELEEKDSESELPLTINNQEKEESANYAIISNENDNDVLVSSEFEDKHLVDIPLEKDGIESTKNNSKSSLFDVIKNIVKEVLKKENLKPIASRDNILNALSLFCIGWVKEGFVSWFLLFLNHKFGKDANDTLLALCLAGVTFGSMTGGFVCGFLSDKVFNYKRPPALFIFFLLLNVFAVALYFVTSQVLSTILLILIFIFIFGGNNTLAVTALLDLGTVRNAALMAGLLTTSQYIASGFSGFLLGYIVEHFGFGYWLLSMLPFSTAAMFMMAWSAGYIQVFLKPFKPFIRMFSSSFSKLENQPSIDEGKNDIELIHSNKSVNVSE